MRYNLPFDLSGCENLVKADAMFFQGVFIIEIAFDHLLSIHTKFFLLRNKTHTHTHTLLVMLIVSMYGGYTDSKTAIDISLITGISSLGNTY